MKAQKKKIEPLDESVKKRLTQKDSDRIHKILMNSDKMASLGQLILGVAHELNNPISFIESNVIFLEKYFGDLRRIIEIYDAAPVKDPETQARIEAHKKDMEYEFAMSDLDNILKSFNEGATRIRSIIASLSAFSRGDKRVIEEVSVHEAIDNTINLLRHKSRHTVEFIKTFEASPMVQANRSEINQVLMNLIINAIHAIQHKFPEGQKGTVTIHTYSRDGHLVAEIRDNGEGIPKENLEKIFNPFFTTKKEGEGTGLGLPISKEIVEKHNGEIRVTSVPGEGTCFTVILPVVHDDPNEKD